MGFGVTVESHRQQTTLAVVAFGQDKVAFVQLLFPASTSFDVEHRANLRWQGVLGFLQGGEAMRMLSGIDARMEFDGLAEMIEQHDLLLLVKKVTGSHLTTRR